MSFIFQIHNLFQLRPIPLTGASAEPQSVTPEELKQTQCTKVVFLLLDFLDRWLREWHWQKGSDCRSDEHYAVIKVNDICTLSTHFYIFRIIFVFLIDCFRAKL